MRQYERAYGTKMSEPVVYDVIARGKRGFVLKKRGNRRPTRAYKDGYSMRVDVSYYLFSRDCTVFVHEKDGTVSQLIRSGFDV